MLEFTFAACCCQKLLERVVILLFCAFLEYTEWIGCTSKIQNTGRHKNTDTMYLLSKGLYFFGFELYYQFLRTKS